MPDPDPTARLLRGVDAPRPLPATLRDRISAALGGNDGVAAEAVPADVVPRLLPADADARITAAVLVAAEGVGDRLDRPRALPPQLYARLELALLHPPATRGGVRRRWFADPRALAVAASLLLFLAVTAVVTHERGAPDRLATAPGSTEPGTIGADTGPSPSGPAGPAAGVAPPAGGTLPQPTPPGPAGSTSGTGARPAPSGSAAARRPATPSAGSEAASGQSGRQGPPPPYSNRSEPAPAAAPAAGCCGSPSPSPTERKEALVVGVTVGDARAEAGFRAYVEETNRAGGVGGRQLRLVASGRRTTPARGSLVTVNLGVADLAGWTGGPLLETLNAPEGRLTGDVFAVSSVVERQAHLAADEVFPSDGAGGTAVVFTSDGPPWADRVPAAFESVLRSRGVTVTRVPYDPSSPVFPPADAALLSLDPDATARWLRDADAAGYSPTRGVTGIYPLHDSTLAAVAPANTRLLSPYRVPTGAEAAALSSAVGPLDARAVHGWATAKHLAVALWRSGAQTAAQIADALRAMRGYDGGLAPPYETRTGTNSRRPEALLHRLEGDDFVADGSFRTDPH